MQVPRTHTLLLSRACFSFGAAAGENFTRITAAAKSGGQSQIVTQIFPYQQLSLTALRGVFLVWLGSVNRRRVRPSWELSGCLNFFDRISPPQGAELAEPPTTPTPSHCFPPFSFIYPPFLPCEQESACHWALTPPGSLLIGESPRRAEARPWRPPAPVWIPKVRIVFERKDKICFNGILRMKH